ncbi:MAG: hypothetical protein ACR2NP_04655, partial [Pirellulaceae bacterium]
MQQTRYNRPMVPTVFGFLWALCLICPSQAVCQPWPDDATVRALLRQLDSDRIASRNRAEADLIALGPELLPWLNLHQNELRWTSESRHRVARIREILFQRRIDQAMQASRVELQPGLTSPQIAQAVLGQTGNSMLFAPPGNVEYPASSGEFWPWLVEFGEMHRFQIDETSFDDVRLIPFDEKRDASTAVAFRGPLSLTLLDGRQPDGGMTNQLQFRLMWEPRIRPVGIRVPLAGMETVDTQDQPWANFNRQAVLNIPVAGNRFM